jgi:hypothetical protein
MITTTKKKYLSLEHPIVMAAVITATKKQQ